MEIALLVLEYLKVLVWPAVVMVGILIFRRSLRALISRIRKGSGWGVAIELEGDADQLAAESVQLPELKGKTHSQTEDPPQGSDRESRLGRVLTAWSAVEREAAALASRLGLIPRTNLGVLSRELLAKDLVSGETAKVMNGLQQLRNRIVHTADTVDLTDATVEDFVLTSRNLSGVLSALQPPKPVD
ncbi:hypothetical protein [Microbacterium terregens]|uniref:DUF4145 domain-containing protein n=1 Tax=Microbacterium terregens TaxID=69363 RepID=A0ABV5SYM2_9MICO